MDPPSITPEQYTAIEKYLERSIEAGSDFLFDAETFLEPLRQLAQDNAVRLDSILSFLWNLRVFHVKKTAPKLRTHMESIVQSYSDGSSLIELAKQRNYPSSLLARMLLEKATTVTGKALTAILRDPHKIAPDIVVQDSFFDVPRLVSEVESAVRSDPLYGPRHDHARRRVGIEFEVVLEFKLKKLGIPFENEAQLRERGTSRTPDVRLLYPIGIQVDQGNGEVDWKMVCWIDSKALFGDVKTHSISVLPQAESYVHRFGPGLVIYWFGTCKELLQRTNDVEVLCDVPKRFMLPTGEIITKDD